VNQAQAIAAVAAAPLSPAAHLRLGDIYDALDRPVPAVACWRTAATLARDDSDLRSRIDRRLAARGPDELLGRPEIQDHNRRYRWRVLAAALTRVAGRDDFSVLDIGGGDGGLCLLLPRSGYLLAEPGTNGLTGEALPFPSGSVDVVAACHVLEHVPSAAREPFLDSLLRVSRGDVVLLGPLEVPGTLYRRRLELVLEITGAGWAREHLACGLPTRAEIEAHAAARGLRCTIDPVGSLGTALLMVFVDHYAHLAGRTAELARINAIFNDLDPDLLTSPGSPGAFLVHLSAR